MKVNGYYTVEATFVVSICVWVIVALCYGGLYIHDRLVMETVTNQIAYRGFSDETNFDIGEWKTKCRKELDKSLYLMKVRTVNTDRGVNAIKIKIRYRLPISFRYLKKILSGGKTELVFETSREMIQPAKYRWNYDLIVK